MYKRESKQGSEKRSEKPIETKPITENSKSLVILKILNSNEKQKFFDFVELIENEYFPHLSQREGGTEEFINDIFNARLLFPIIIAEKNKQIIGTIAGFFTDEFTLYIHLLHVSKDYRNTKDFLAFKLINEMINIIPIKVSKVTATTWEGNNNSLNLMQHIGFKIIGKKEHDMVDERTTIYLEAELSTVKEKLKRYEKFINR